MSIKSQSDFAKHSELTWGVHPAVIKEVLGEDFCCVEMTHEEVVEKLNAMDHGVVGCVRSLLAKHLISRQLIVYGLTFKIVTIDGLPKVLFGVYKRNKKNAEAGHEARLALNISLGAGGHAEFQDTGLHHVLETCLESNVVSLLETATNSLYREYPEEVAVDVDGREVYPLATDQFRFAGFVMDSKPEDNKYVGNSHFGIIATINVDKNATFEMVEDNNDAIAFASVKELQDYYTLSDMQETSGLRNNPAVGGVDFEPWSALIVERIHLLERKLLKEFNLI